MSVEEEIIRNLLILAKQKHSRGARYIHDQILIYKTILYYDSLNETALTEITDYYLKLNLIEEAAAFAEKAHFLYGKKNATAAVNMSRIYIAQKAYKKAIEVLEIMTKVDAADFRLYFNLGYAYELNGQFEEALENYSTSISLKGKNPSAFFRRGKLKYEKYDKEEGLKDLEKAVEYEDYEARLFLMKVVKSPLILN
jgi:tetratricopeptide (TPR) repeat protein